MARNLQRTFALLVCSAGVLAQGCGGVECGEGTVERGGDCVSEETPSNTCVCGLGTHFDDDLGVCVADYAPAVCNAETTVEVIRDDNVILCKGDCSGGCPPACPLPAVGHVTICGQVVSIETTGRIDADGGGTGMRCDEIPVEERTGPCLMKLSVSDGIDWPISSDALDVTLYDCGYFAVTNIPAPASGRLLLTVDDADGSAAEEWVPTASMLDVEAGERVESVNAYGLRHSTDQAWTESAGWPFGGATFSEKGTLAMIFLRGDTPVDFVQIVRSPGGVEADDDYYFSDSDRYTRSTITLSQYATGHDGAGLIVNSPLVDHGGSGGLPDLCVWPWEPAASIPGVLMVTERRAARIGGGLCE